MSEWRSEWTKWGYTPDGVRRGVDRTKNHLLHQCGETPGLNKQAFAFWVETGVSQVRVICTDGSIFTARLDDLLRDPKRKTIDYYEPQWGWPRLAWDFIPPPRDLDQLRLFG